MASTTPIPNYLDFNALRTEGITHLGNLTGKIWTDYNVHDPGITILEALCYALLDLDYRGKLPAADIFARDPKVSAPDDNFYSPAQILTCNPLTILDYRKLLSDIEGVRNAWLEVATDQTDNLNGLYHVFIEKEDNTPEKDIRIAVLQQLWMHRNLCEDFVDITFVVKQPLGVCAIIELDTNADAAQIYLDMMQKLGDFLSPTPHFYTLKELLDKNKPIDTIFAGRPYNKDNSHGFIDTDELEKIQLKRELHLSDLYKVLFDIAGIKTIRDLQWKSGNNAPSGAWRLNLQENHVVDFQPRNCGIQFLRNGKPIPFDPTQYDALLGLAMKKNLYKTLLPNLDLPFPQGNFRDDLASYYSIQNDFPNAYGIAKGGIPDDAPMARKAWALQLKGFLLFFDQLLADYLSQLANIRSLFSMGSSGNAPAANDCSCSGPTPAGTPSAPPTGTPSVPTTGTTYFLNPLDNSNDPEAANYVPDVDKLWRSYVDQPLSDLLGGDGATLVFPADRKTLEGILQQTITSQQPTDTAPGDLTPQNFPGWEEMQDLITGLKADFAAGTSLRYNQVPYKEKEFYYYISTSAADTVLVSKKTFAGTSGGQTDQRADAQTRAKAHADFVLNSGMLDNPYSLFSIAGDKFTFTIEYKQTSIGNILHAEMEDAALYAKRRQYFLDHLLSRFAEKFTDFAMLQYAPAAGLQPAPSGIAAEEYYLSHYATLSSQRGQAGNYTAKKWNTDQVSGFEKKWKALIGADNTRRQSLCNFITKNSEPEYIFTLQIGDTTFFNPADKYDSEETARQTAAQLLSAMSDRSNYSIREIAAATSYSIHITYAPGYSIPLAASYPSEIYATTIADRLSALFGQRPSGRDVFASAYTHKLRLVDYSGKVSKLSVQSYNSAEDATKAAEGSLVNDQAPDATVWQPASDNSRSPGILYRNTLRPDVLQYMDLGAFKIDINDTIIGRPDKFTYDVLPVNNGFKFRAEEEFDNKEDALAHGKELLLLATAAANYWLEEDTSGLCAIWITNAGRRQAGYPTNLPKDEALKQVEKIQDQFRRQLYTLQVSRDPSRWKFHYYLGYEDTSRYCFDSITEYDSAAAAQDALRLVWQGLPSLTLQQEQSGWTLRSTDPAIPVTTLISATAAAPAAQLHLQQAIQKVVSKPDPQDFVSVSMDPISQQGPYSWQLVNVDHPVALCTRDYDDQSSAEKDKAKLAGLLKQGIRFLEICMDGKITRKRKDPLTGEYGYHYLVRSHNYFYSSGKQLILFESVKGYPSEEEAKQAFHDGYLPLFEWAAKDTNYGPVISLTEIFSNTSPAGSPIVFVPKETKVSLGGADTDVIKRLVDISGSYPIKRIECPLSNTDPCAGGPPKTYVYYCGITIPDTTPVTPPNAPDAPPFEWQSTCRFATIAEAQLDFEILIRLLQFPGNLFTDVYETPDKTTYRIYIHEVMAASARRFGNEPDTWENVEKFICALREEDSVLCYQTPDCSNNFLVNCGQPIFQHPCTYSTPKTRDAALDLLQFALWNPKAFTSYREDPFLVLTEGQGLPFAKAPMGNTTDDEKKDDIQLVTALITNVYDETNIYSIKDDFAQLANANGNVIATSYQPGIRLEDWKQLLHYFARQYPIVLTDDQRYSIELHLPDLPAAAPTEPASPAPTCYVAWKSTCLFTDSKAAQQALEKGLDLLAHSDYYLPVFSSDCRCFGIALADPADKIAIHPQSYISRELVIAAVQRMQKAVNVESLHLVEHILLRPQSDLPEDRISNAKCSEPAECSFPWKDTLGDPRTPVKDIFFIPGDDPWSFIATIALPAWPNRFSPQDNKIVLENILYREAPAHVMLRVLWLRPQDCSLFETQYKRWLKAIAAQKKDGKKLPDHAFADFLFSTTFTMPAECQPCHPCPPPPATINPCADNLKTSRAKKLPVLAAEVNKLYCWKATPAATNPTPASATPTPQTAAPATPPPAPSNTGQ